MVFNKEYIGLHGLRACPKWTIFFVKGIFEGRNSKESLA